MPTYDVVVVVVAVVVVVVVGVVLFGSLESRKDGHASNETMGYGENIRFLMMSEHILMLLRSLWVLMGFPRVAWRVCG